eukprot:742436-Pleurochrysis_carterae.AAC.2
MLCVTVAWAFGAGIQLASSATLKCQRVSVVSILHTLAMYTISCPSLQLRVFSLLITDRAVEYSASLLLIVIRIALKNLPRTLVVWTMTCEKAGARRLRALGDLCWKRVTARRGGAARGERAGQPQRLLDGPSSSGFEARTIHETYSVTVTEGSRLLK